MAGGSEPPMNETQLAIKRAIQEIGSSGRYQKRLIAIMTLLWVEVTYSVMINSFIFMNPVFKCGGQELPEPQACLRPGYCKIVNDYTGVYEAGLYCQASQIRSTIQGVYPIGCLLGVFIVSALSDIKGRRFSMLFCIANGVIGTICLLQGILIKNINLIILGQVFSGFFSSAAANLSYVATGDVVSSQMRQRSIMIYCKIWGLTQLTFILIENYIPNWDFYLLWLNLVPLLLLFVMVYLFLLESPSFYLIMKKDLQTCKQHLAEIAKINRTEKELNSAYGIVEQAYRIGNGSSTKKKETSIMNILVIIFSDSWYRTAIICMSCIQMGFNTFYYGVLSSLERTGASFGMNVFLIGLHEAIGYTFAGIYIVNLQRRKGLFIVNVATSVLGLLFLFPFVRNSELVTSVIISLCTLGFVYSYSLSQMVNTEAYSAEIQSTAIGISTTLSQVGRSLTPFILNAMNDMGMHPIIAVSSIFFILGVPPVYFLKETLKNKKDPDTQSQLSMSQSSITVSDQKAD